MKKKNLKKKLRRQEKMDLNKVILVGRLTKDIELKSTQSGNQYAQFDLAVGNGKDKEGNERKADFITCIAWNKGAENLSVYLHKGQRIAVEGRLKADSYKNDKGENRTKNYVLVESYEFLEPKQKDNFVPQEPEGQKKDPYKEFGDSIELAEKQQEMDFDDNSLPF